MNDKYSRRNLSLLVGSQCIWFWFQSTSVYTHEKLRSSHWMCSVRKGVLENFAKLQGNTCARDSFSIKLQDKVWHFIKKEALTQLFSCEFCETWKNNFFTPFPDIFRGYRKRTVALRGFRSIQNMYRYKSTKLRGTHEFWSYISYRTLNWLFFIKELVPKHMFVKYV